MLKKFFPANIIIKIPILANFLRHFLIFFKNFFKKEDFFT